jgi:hypothetical protein
MFDKIYSEDTERILQKMTKFNIHVFIKSMLFNAIYIHTFSFHKLGFHTPQGLYIPYYKKNQFQNHSELVRLVVSQFLSTFAFKGSRPISTGYTGEAYYIAQAEGKPQKPGRKKISIQSLDGTSRHTCFCWCLSLVIYLFFSLVIL